MPKSLKSDWSFIESQKDFGLQEAVLIELFWLLKKHTPI